MMFDRHELEHRRILVIGFGRQGRALARWLPYMGAKVVVNDRRSPDELRIDRKDYPGVDFILGEHPAAALDGVHLVCVSGGVPLNLPLLIEARERGIPLTNDAQLFLENCPAPVVGITGSAGKTTTTTLTYEIIKAAGYTTWMGGNSGEVLLDDLDNIQPDHVVVMELSSFQLELMTRSPQVGTVLNITPNHLDRHGSMQNYIAAKANILRHQRPSDVAVLGKDDDNAAALEAVVAAEELVWFSQYDIVPHGAFMMGDRLMLAGSSSYDYAPHVLIDRAEVPLRGDHNLLNVLAACATAGALGLAIDRPGIEPEVMQQVVRDFKPVPHRLEVVRVRKGVTYVNDSIATAPERVIAALKSFKEPLVLLIGGADKDLPWENVLHLALQKARHIVVFGKSGEKQVSDKVVRLLRLRGADARVYTQVDTLDEAVMRAAEVAQMGDVVLLSPGGTSYDAYGDFAERGEHFRRLVSEL